MKYLVRLATFVAVWAVVTASVMVIVARVEPLEAAEGADAEAVWNWWLGLSVGLLLTLALTMGYWVYNRRRHPANVGTDLRGGK